MSRHNQSIKNVLRNVIFSQIFIFFFSFCSDKFDGKNGTKIVYFPKTEKIKQSIEYRNGKKNGLYQEFYQNGMLKQKVFFIDDQAEDTTFTYYPNGKLEEFQIFSKGQKEGCWKKFNKEGMMYSAINFKNDRFDGESSTYTYRTGRLKERYHFKNGVKDGKQETFYNNGRLESVTYFSDGLPCLGTEEWYENGNVVPNDFKITISEKNQIQLNNTITYYIKLENPKSDDEVYEISEINKNGRFDILRNLKKEDGVFVLDYLVYKGGFLMQKSKLAVLRKTDMGNTFIKTTTINVSANNF